MAYFFNNPDPMGLGQAFQNIGSTISSTILQKQLQKIQQQQLLEAERRKEQSILNQSEKQRELGQILGPILGIAQDPTLPIKERLGALQEYVTQTGDTSLLPLMKDISKEGRDINLLQGLGINPLFNPTTPGMETFQNRSNELSSSSQTGQIPEETLVALSASQSPQIKNVIDTEFKRRALDLKRFEGERKYHSEQALPYTKAINTERSSLRDKNLAISELEAAISSGETGGVTINNLARIFNRPEWLTVSGAQLYAGAKELLLSNLGRAGRLNMWIEQQIAGALPELGKSPEANATVLEGIKGGRDLTQAKIRLHDQIANEDMKKYGYIRGDIASRIDKAIEPIADEIERRVSYRTRVIYEKEKGIKGLRDLTTKKVPSQTPLTPEMMKVFIEKYQSIEKAIENSKKLGYVIYSPEKILEYMK